MRRLLYLLAVTLVVAAPLEAQQYGAYAAVDGDEMFITELVSLDEPGSIHLYRRSGGSWEEAGILKGPPDRDGDYFGRFVIKDGETLIVGATAVDTDEDDDSDGAVYVFRRSGDGWELASTLAPEGAAAASFGRFGALSGDLLFVSGLGYNGARGGVWVFARDGSGGWTQEAILSPEDAPASEFFGWGIAFDGERLLAGAVQNYPNGGGAVYVYRRGAPGSWELETTLEPSEDESNQGFGQTVAWLSGRALVGAPGADRSAGAVHVYSRNRTTNAWTRDLTLTAFDRQPGSGFGSALLPGDGELLVSAPGADDRGRVYRLAYDASSGRFGAAQKLEGIDQEPGDAFGSVIASDGRTAVVGQLGDDFGLGSAIVLTRAEDGWRAAQKLFGPDPSGLQPITAGEVRCADEGQADLFECRQVDILSFLPVAAIGGGRGSETNDVWGWTDPATRREYALVGRTDGTAFIDVTDPVNPSYLGNLPKTPGSRGNSWRDIKVYDNHAFIVADGALQHGMQVFDLTRLRDVGSPPVEFEPDALYEGIASAHNIVINEASGFAYSVGSSGGGETCGGGLHMIDIQDPVRPTFIGCFQDETTGYASTGYSHDAMCINYDGPDTEHAGKEICFGSNENFLSIADVTDKQSPIALSKANYPSVAYAHQGWITEDHRYFFMNDEGDESSSIQSGTPMAGTRTLIWDVTDLDDPVMIKEHFGTEFTIDHNLYIKGNLMYQSNYVSGLRVLDISDPENPVEVGFFDTVPWSQEVEFDGSWSNYPFFESGTIVVSSGKEGVFFLKHRQPELVP